MKKVYRYSELNFRITRCNECDMEIPYEEELDHKYIICTICIERLRNNDLLEKQRSLWIKFVEKPRIRALKMLKLKGAQ